MTSVVGVGRIGRMFARFGGVGLVVVGCLGGCASGGAAPREAQDPSATRPSKSIAQRAMDELPASLSDAPPPPLGEPADEPKGSGVAIPGSDLVRGSATVVVHAPVSKVREAALGFGSYAEFMPHYKKARVLGRTAAGARDVYMEIDVLHGALSMWARVEVPKPVTDGDVETITMRFVEGNVRELSGGWRIRRVDDERTELTLEIFLKPTIPLPASVLNDENISGAVKGVVAMRDRIEKAAAQSQ